MENPNSSQDVWKWWEKDELAKNKPGVNWTFLEHNGPILSPAYKKIPEEIKFFYDEKPMSLSEEAEEVASFYAKMLNDKYASKKRFKENFFADWRKVMTEDEKEKIKEFSKCDFKQMHEYFLKQTKDDKQEKILEEKHGFCMMDGHKQRIAKFKFESCLITDGEDNPKMGKVKRLLPKHVTINCSKDSKFDKDKWEKVVHKPNVAWLASWNWLIGNEKSKTTTYMNFDPSSKVKGLADFEKYEMARRLHTCIDKIRENYTKDWESGDVKIKQRAVALYFIDKLALRVGNKTEERDTFGCCTLRVKHITLYDQKDDKQHVVHLKFLGKKSVPYDNEILVEELVYKNLQQFKADKEPEDDLFDHVSAENINNYLETQMSGLTAKVFRTYHASCTLQEQLDKYDEAEDSPKEFYQNAIQKVAKLCNHQRSLPKNQIKNVQVKIEEKLKSISAAEKDESIKNSTAYENDKTVLKTLENEMRKLMAPNYFLGSSENYYVDPRITVSWCKNVGLDIKKIFNESQRNRFCWAIESAVPEFRF